MQNWNMPHIFVNRWQVQILCFCCSTLLLSALLLVLVLRHWQVGTLHSAKRQPVSGARHLFT